MYSQKFSSLNPGCVVILLDHSFSMNDPWGQSGVRKEILASNINKILLEISRKCKNGDIFKERVQIGVIGYHSIGEEKNIKSAFSFKGSLDNHQDLVNISDLDANIKLEMKKVQQPDGEGGIIELNKEIPTWIEPFANGGTPMKEAFEKAEEIISSWVADTSHANSFPPIVINITDGEYTSGTPKDVIERIKSIKTNDGNTLVFNIHIADGSNSYLFPDTDERLTDYALELFDWSSELPENMVSNGKKVGFTELTSKSKGFIFNGDAASVVKFLEFGTLLQIGQER